MSKNKRFFSKVTSRSRLNILIFFYFLFIYFNYWFKLYLTIYHRMHYIIIIKSQVILDLVEDMTESLPFVIIGSRINYSKQQTLICKYRKRYSYKYMDNIKYK